MSRAPLRLGVIGVGKIARDQHIPALHADPDFAFVAAASRNANADEPGVEDFYDLDAMLASGLPLDAVSICTPPVGRHVIARTAIEAGLHVLIEKPPGATVSEVLDLARRAEARGVTLFATWHSREAEGVEPARAWLSEREVRSVRVDWREDIRVWHPGQEWILVPGGLGVFDPGINALSILTRILPGPVLLEGARLEFPAGRGAPVRASLSMRHDDRAPVAVEFDFLQTGPQSWDIVVETDGGTLRLAEGGQKLFVDDVARGGGENREYPRLYRRFAELTVRGESDVDVSPLQLTADAFLLGEREEGEPFSF